MESKEVLLLKITDRSRALAATRARNSEPILKILEEGTGETPLIPERTANVDLTRAILRIGGGVIVSGWEVEDFKWSRSAMQDLRRSTSAWYIHGGTLYYVAEHPLALDKPWED